MRISYLFFSRTLDNLLGIVFYVYFAGDDLSASLHFFLLYTNAKSICMGHRPHFNIHHVFNIFLCNLTVLALITPT